MRPIAVLALPILLNACALPALSIATLAIDGISYATSGKSVSDHALSAVANEDCAMWRVLQERPICRDADVSETMVAAAPIQPPSPMPAPAAGPSSRGGSAALVDQTYRSQLALSAPPVSTAPAGPTASPSLTGGQPAPLATAAAWTAAAPSSALPLRPLSRLDANGSAVSYRAAQLHFKTGSARIGKGDRKKLREVATLQRKRNATLRIIGHASSRTRDLDPVNHQIANFRVSVDRAHAVARALVRLGVPPSKLYIGAKSDQERVFYEFMPAGETENQRAEIYIEY